MGLLCCRNKNNKNYDLDSCQSISDLRNYISEKIENAEIEQEEIKLYLEDNEKIPASVDIVAFTEQDLKKRVEYLEEIKNCLNEIDDLLKKHPTVDIDDIKNSLKEFQVMYTWIYDDSKRCENWLKVFKNFVENDENEA